jgi:hypothetical protein
MTSESPVVVFDLDLTLTNRDTASGFFSWLLKRQPWRLLLTLVAVPLLAFDRAKWVALRYMVWVATLGESEGRLQELLQVYVDEVLHAPFPMFRGDGLNRLAWHVAQGHRVIVATGLPGGSGEGVAAPRRLRRRHRGRVDTSTLPGRNDREAPLLRRHENLNVDSTRISSAVGNNIYRRRIGPAGSQIVRTAIPRKSEFEVGTADTPGARMGTSGSDLAVALCLTHF